MSADEVVFITGSSRGIGRALSRRFSQERCQVVITYHDDAQAGQRVLEECRQLGSAKVLAIPLDLNEDQSIREAVSEVMNNFGKIDVLINNAGLLIQKPLAEFSFAEIERQLSVNLVGTIKITRECLPHVQKCIVNVGSNLGLLGRKTLSVYSASKFGLRGFTQSLAQEQPNLRVYAVHPGLTATRMGSPAGVKAEKVADIIYNVVVGRYRIPSGTDVKVRHYLRGGFWRMLMKTYDCLAGK